MDMSPLVAGAADMHLPLPPLLAAVNVDLDKTVFLQMAVFAILIAVLKPLLFDPMLRLFALREERTDGARADARAMQEKAAEILTNYDAELGRARAEAGAEREALRRETARLEAQILAEARAAVETITSEGRARALREVEVFERELGANQAVLTAEIARRVLGREISA